MVQPIKEVANRMICAGCKLEFPNLNALTKHKTSCPGANSENQTNDTIKGTDSQGNTNPEPKGKPPTTKENKKGAAKNKTQSSAFILPINICPEEVKLLALGQTVGLRITGTNTKNGVEVGEVTFIR